jgi:NDP-sugar pyrophosphorylase family protein
LPASNVISQDDSESFIGHSNEELDRSVDPADVTAVLLCAGRGVRLRPLTDNVPKALVEVHGLPLLDYHLRALQRLGIPRVILVVGYLGDKIRQHVGDGAAFGLSVEYAEQAHPRGTGDGLMTALPLVDTPFVMVVYADVYLGDSPGFWRELLRNRRPKIVGAVVPNAGTFGRLFTTNGHGTVHLESIREKDGMDDAGLVNAGVYFLTEPVTRAVPLLTPSPRGELELTDAISQYTMKGGIVEVPTTDYWQDIGTLQSLKRANEQIESQPSTWDPGRGG